MTTSASVIPLQRFEYNNTAENSHKFWEVSARVENSTRLGVKAQIVVYVHWGRLGGVGRGQSKEYMFTSRIDAEEFVNKKITEKLSKGYHRAGRTGSNTPMAGPLPSVRVTPPAQQDAESEADAVAANLTPEELCDAIVAGLRQVKDAPPEEFASWWNDLKPYWEVVNGKGHFRDPDAIPRNILHDVYVEMAVVRDRDRETILTAMRKAINNA